MNKIKEVKYDDLHFGAKFWFNLNIGEEGCAGIKPSSRNDKVVWENDRITCHGWELEGHTVYILDEEKPVEKQWPEKMILVCRNSDECLRLGKIIDRNLEYQSNCKMPVYVRVESKKYKGYNEETMGCYESDAYKDYVIAEASDYFSESRPSVEAAENKTETIIEKGNSNMTYQVRAILEAENRAGVGMIPLQEVLPITTIDANCSQNAAFLAGQKTEAEVDPKEAHRLKVTVKEF